MMKKIFVSITLLCLSKHTISQYDTYNEMQQGYQYPYQNLQYQQYRQEYENPRWKVNEDYNEYDENICRCDKCDELKPGCLSSCPNCLSPQSIVPPNYIFLPFPYPYPMTTKEIVTTESTTTQTASTTTTTEATTLMTSTEATTLMTSTEATETTISEATQKSTWPEETDTTVSPFHVKQKSPYMITSLRKTKPHLLSKYGILPISDTFAEKLMLQLRSMKVLHPRKDYSRDVDEIAPYE